MTYSISLSNVALAIGLIGLLTHIAILFFEPAQVRRFLMSLPRHKQAGIGLMVLADIWMTILLQSVDLGEFSDMRMTLILCTNALFILTIIFLPDFLFARAMGIILLLGTEVLLSAAFLVEHPAKHIITVLAYAWAIVGMFFVASPYLLRDIIEWGTRTDLRLRAGAVAKLTFSVVLVALGIWVF